MLPGFSVVLLRKGKDPNRVIASPVRIPLQQRASTLALADHVLALHKDIDEVLVLEEKAGEYVVVGEASREGVTLLADNMNIASKPRLLAPMIILGSANQLGGQQSKLVGIEYPTASLLFVPLDEDKLLALSTKSESIQDVWQTIRSALPELQQRSHEVPVAFGAVTSTAEAEARARHFITERFPRESSRIVVGEVSFREPDQQWQVYGSFRARFWSLSRKFLVEIDARDGSVKRFVIVPPPPPQASSMSSHLSSSSLYLIVATACVVVAGALAVMLFAGLLRI
jgi:hypothetical protein